MRVINPKCLNIDSFKYSILISLYYYEINSRPERISKLKKYEDKYNVTDTTPENFEVNKSNVSLTIVDKDDNPLYTSVNYLSNKAKIVKISDHQYAALKGEKSKHTKLKELPQTFTHDELTDYILRKIVY